MIDTSKFSQEDIGQLTKYFLENRIIKFKDILSPIEQYFWKLDLNVETQSYELYLGVPKDWAHDMTMNTYGCVLVSENGNGKVIKLVNNSEEFAADFDELLLFAIDIIERNNAIQVKIKEKEKELQEMRDRMVQIQMSLSKEIENLKTIKHEKTEAVTVTTEESVGEVEEEASVDNTEAPAKPIEVVEEQGKAIDGDMKRLEELLHGKSI